MGCKIGIGTWITKFLIFQQFWKKCLFFCILIEQKKLLRCSAPFQRRLMGTYVDTWEELWLPGSWVLVIPLLLIAVFTSSGIIFIIFTSSLTQGHVLQCMSDMGAPCWQHTGLCARALTCETSVTRECQHQGCHDMNHWKERQQYLSFTDSDETVELLDLSKYVEIKIT